VRVLASLEPSFLQNFANDPSFVGNRSLRPERSRSLKPASSSILLDRHSSWMRPYSMSVFAIDRLCCASSSANSHVDQPRRKPRARPRIECAPADCLDEGDRPIHIFGYACNGGGITIKRGNGNRTGTSETPPSFRFNRHHCHISARVHQISTPPLSASVRIRMVWVLASYGISLSEGRCRRQLRSPAFGGFCSRESRMF